MPGGFPAAEVLRPCEPGQPLSDMSAVVSDVSARRTMDPGSVLLAATSERHTGRSQASRIRQTYREKVQPPHFRCGGRTQGVGRETSPSVALSPATQLREGAD